LIKRKTIKPTTIAEIITPTQTPASKIPPTSSQELSNNSVIIVNSRVGLFKIAIKLFISTRFIV
jgi:hypothetical protein